MNVLGIETSCDETSAAVVADGRTVLSSIVASQADLHARWGGVVPEVASRKHVERVLPVIHEALGAAGLDWRGVHGVAVTNRPGLVGALLVGVSAAKALAHALALPIVGVHHLEGHLRAALLAEPDLGYPHLCLLVSGGHTEILEVRAPGDLASLGATRDDAAGECFDKCARVLGLPYPGGPHIEAAGRDGDPARVAFPRAWLGDTLDFSFSGLKTAVARFAAEDQGATPLADVAASFEAAVVDVLVTKTMRAARLVDAPAVTIGGGVAANGRLGETMRQACVREGRRLVVPPPALCTDNAAMIAAAGYDRLSRGESDPLTFDTWASAPLMHAAPPAVTSCGR